MGAYAAAVRFLEHAVHARKALDVLGQCTQRFPALRLLDILDAAELLDVERRILAEIPPKRRLAGLAPPERLAGLTREEILLAFPDDELRRLPEDYLATFPEATRSRSRPRGTPHGNRLTSASRTPRKK